MCKSSKSLHLFDPDSRSVHCRFSNSHRERDQLRWEFLRKTLLQLSADNFTLLELYWTNGDHDLLPILNGLGVDWRAQFLEIQGPKFSSQPMMSFPLSFEAAETVMDLTSDLPEEQIYMKDTAVSLRSWTRHLFSYYGLMLPSENVLIFPEDLTWSVITGDAVRLRNQTTYEALDLDDFLLTEQIVPD